MKKIYKLKALLLSTLFVSCSKPQAGIDDFYQFPSELRKLSGFESAEIDQIYILREGGAPWGDYGSILVHGMSGHAGRSMDGRIRLERTGPFVPPITFPGIGDIIVTDEMKLAMEAAGFVGIEFKPVIKEHIVRVDWHTWDFEAEDPKYYPKEGEPEGYVLDKNHSKKMSKYIGDLWEVVPSIGAATKRIQVGEKSWDVEFEYVAESWNGSDLFKVKENGYKYVSPRAKAWFEEYFPKWSSFEDGTRH